MKSRALVWRQDHANISKHYIAVLLLILIAVGKPASSQTLADVLTMELVVHFVDVGVGDAILIELPDRAHEVVIDGGDRREGFNFLEYIRPHLDDPVELAVITHPDYDHWSGIERLFEEHSIEQLWDPGYDGDCKFRGSEGKEKKEKDQYLRFLQKVNKGGISLKRPVPVDPLSSLFELDDVKLWVLHAGSIPPEGECANTINNTSVVIRMQYKDVVFLFTGDINGKKQNERASVEPRYVEAQLLALAEEHPDILQAHVLKVPHHGSNTASTTRFIKAVAPRFAVISSSVTTHSRLPAERVVRRYERVRFQRSRKIEKVLRTNFREGGFETRQFGDDHIVCGTNGKPNDLACDYFWRFQR